jgi:glycosyltransferase involved in cell wall biosynthesis
MKIAFINQPWTPAVPAPTGDSIGIWTYNTACQLAASHHVLIYGGDKSFFRKAEKIVEGIYYRSLGSTIDQLLLNRLLGKFDLFLHKLKILRTNCPFIAANYFYLTYIYQVAIDLKEQQCDVVHIHNFSQFVPIIRAFNPKAKIVLHMHCEWLTQFEYSIIENRLRQVDMIIGCSEHITEKIQKRFPQFADRCKTVYNGVDVELFGGNLSAGLHSTSQRNQPTSSLPLKSREDRNKKILFVGRISPEKGLHLLLDAFREINRRYPNTELEIVGSEVVAPRECVFGTSNEPEVLGLSQFYSGSYLEKLKRRLSPDIETRVMFAGYVSHEELPAHYKDADIVINPSLSEAFGMSLAEGMSSGIPVIATRVGGMRSVVQEGKTGLLVEANNSLALVEAVCYLLSNDELRKSMGKIGRQRALDLFSWEKITESLETEYKHICKHHEHFVSSNSSLRCL